MVSDLLWILGLVIFGGLLGALLSAPHSYRENRNGTSETEHRGAQDGGRFTRLRRVQFAIKPIMAGVGGAIVGVAFAGGLVEHNYQEISLAAKDSAKFVGGVLRLLAVAILGGYLGVRLIDQVAERLLSQKIKQMEDKLDSVRSEFDVERTIRESAKSVRDGFPSRALGVLDELLQHVPHGVIRPDDLANVRVLRGYALKRLGRLREALQEVEASLRIKPTYAGWYNKACYTALLNPTVDDASTATVREALVEAHKLAESQGGTATLIRTLMEDTEGNGDLSALKNADFILEIVGD